jgi:hypothetical protein
LALELHVIDNGPGVPDSIKDRIFYPLVSGREGGSGLGADIGTNLCTTAPRIDRSRQRARPYGFQDIDSVTVELLGLTQKQ